MSSARRSSISATMASTDLGPPSDAVMPSPFPPTVKALGPRMRLRCDIGTERSPHQGRCARVLGAATVLFAGGLLTACAATPSAAPAHRPGRLTTTSSSAPTTTTTAPAPSDLALGTAATITSGGAPAYDVTAIQFVDPAQPADSYYTPQSAGDIFVAVDYTFRSDGASVNEDIYSDTEVYDAGGQGFSGAFEDPANGAGFPTGVVSLAPGGTASGWVMYEVPAGQPVVSVKYTPSSGYATQATVSWSVPASG